MKLYFTLSFFIVSIFSQMAHSLSTLSILSNPLFEKGELRLERTMLSYEDEVRRDAKTIFSLLEYKKKLSLRLINTSSGDTYLNTMYIFTIFTLLYSLFLYWLNQSNTLSLKEFLSLFTRTFAGIYLLFFSIISFYFFKRQPIKKFKKRKWKKSKKQSILTELKKQEIFFDQIKNLRIFSDKNTPIFRKNSIVNDKLSFEIDKLPTVEDFKKQTKQERQDTFFHINAIIEDFVENSMQDIKKRLLNTGKEKNRLFSRTVRIFEEESALSSVKKEEIFLFSPTFSTFFINAAS